jgi:hypothetical protein
MGEAWASVSLIDRRSAGYDMCPTRICGRIAAYKVKSRNAGWLHLREGCSACTKGFGEI